MSDDNKITRRTLVSSAVATAALVPAALVPLTAIQPAAAATSTVFSPGQRRTLEAFMDRLVPKDENGPSASECGAANYIDASLGDFLAAEKGAFLEGLNAVEVAARTAHQAVFADLSPEQQDSVMMQIEKNSRPFFERARRLTLEGMFSDPHYGGNAEYRGWDLIRYPGPRLASAPEDQKIKDPIKPVRMSAYGASHGGKHGH